MLLVSFTDFTTQIGDFADGSTCETLVVTIGSGEDEIEAGETYYLVVDGYREGESGNFGLSMSCRAMAPTVGACYNAVCSLFI